MMMSTWVRNMKWTHAHVLYIPNSREEQTVEELSLRHTLMFFTQSLMIARHRHSIITRWTNVGLICASIKLKNFKSRSHSRSNFSFSFIIVRSNMSRMIEWCNPLVRRAKRKEYNKIISTKNNILIKLHWPLSFVGHHYWNLLQHRRNSRDICEDLSLGIEVRLDSCSFSSHVRTTLVIDLSFSSSSFE